MRWFLLMVFLLVAGLIGWSVWGWLSEDAARQ
jgi:hypothetical protein